MLKQLGIAALRSRGGSVRMEAKRPASCALLNNFFQSDERASTNKQNIGGIDGRKFLVRMFAATLRRYVSYCALENLEQSLLHAFAAHIAGDRRVFVLFSYLVDLVYIDDALLSLLHIAISGLQQFENNIFHVFANVARLCQRGGVHDSEGHIQHPRKRLRQ